jgi:hypothetical protein
MKKLIRFWQRLSAKTQVVIHLLTVAVLVWLIYMLLGCPPFSAEQAFRRAEKAAMVGPSTILGQFQPEEYPCDGLILGQDPEAVYLYVIHKGSPETSELIYREKEGAVTLLAAPGTALLEFEYQAHIPVILYDSCKDAVRAEVDLTVYSGDFRQTYALTAQRESDGYFAFDLVARNAGTLGEEGEALRLLQEVCSNSMAGNADIAFPAAVRLYDAAGALILEETTYIRSAAAQAQNVT